MTRSPATIQNNAAQPADYLKWLDTNLFYSRMLRLDSSPGQRLFPGLGLIGLGTFGLLSRSGSGTGHRRRKIYLGAAVLLAFCLSLGPNLHLSEWQPYWLVGDIIPGFEQLRSPFRFAAFFQLHLALLAGMGLARFVSFRSNPAFLSRQKWADLLGSLIVGLTIFELLALPLPLKQVPNLATITDWQRWLRQQEAPRVIFLPFAPSPRVADFEPTVEWMLGQPHWRGELINGYSGFFPPDHGDLRTALTAFPNAAGLKVLQAKAVDYVVVDYRRPSAPSRETMETALPLAYYDEAAKVGIYRLTAAS
jgi:hypothetical protein